LAIITNNYSLLLVAILPFLQHFWLLSLIMIHYASLFTPYLQALHAQLLEYFGFSMTSLLYYHHFQPLCMRLQVLQNQPLSYPADLWALGCIVFQVRAEFHTRACAAEHTCIGLARTV